MLARYDKAVTSLISHLLEELMRAQDPLLKIVRRTKVDHSPSETAPREIAHGFQEKATEMRTKFSVDEVDLIECNCEAWDAMIWNAAEDMLSQMMPAFFSSIDKACEASGNVVRGVKQPTWEHIIETFEKIALDFDENGQIVMPKLVTSPEVAQKIRSLGPMNPSQQQRFINVIRQKKLEFDANKRIRKLGQ